MLSTSFLRGKRVLATGGGATPVTLDRPGIGAIRAAVRGQAYRAQDALNAISLLPANLYGPRVNFDPRSSHVIPALIRKACEARDAQQDYRVAWAHWSGADKEELTRRFLDVSRAEREFGFQAETSLLEGLEKTIRWYQAQQRAPVSAVA